jgi:catechol 2,3-dioxygenase-like lactoylglutathione lyase family enzyme
LKIDRLDHFVLTVKNIDATCRFYADVLGMEIVTFGSGRRALQFGRQKINLHEQGREFEPKSASPTPGSADFCLISELTADEIEASLTLRNIPIEEGPVTRTGALGPIVSLYVRDPDFNLVEISTYGADAAPDQISRATFASARDRRTSARL